MSFQHFYENSELIAFSIFGLDVRYYGICYAVALLLSLWIAKVHGKKMGFSSKLLDSYFIYIEIGVVLGARFGYIAFYDPEWAFYLYQPWQAFNPYRNGVFVGISGLSFHGAVIGFFAATAIFCRRKRQDPWPLLDLVALSVPLGYMFGRFGNFLNHELFGRETTVPWGIYVEGVLRHPSQLYEAFAEGFLLYLIIFALYKYKKRVNGELIAFYGIFYSLARFVCEYWREADVQIGYLAFGLSLGQLLSLAMGLAGVILYVYRRAKA